MKHFGLALMAMGLLAASVSPAQATTHTFLTGLTCFDHDSNSFGVSTQFGLYNFQISGNTRPIWCPLPLTDPGAVFSVRVRFYDRGESAARLSCIIFNEEPSGNGGTLRTLTSAGSSINLQSFFFDNVPLSFGPYVNMQCNIPDKHRTTGMVSHLTTIEVDNGPLP